MTTNDAKDQGIRVRKSITVGRPIAEVYRFWRDFENLPRFMHHLESVQSEGDRRSRWRTSAHGGSQVEWDAETTEDRANELISWRSVEGADISSIGIVQFRPAPGAQGTEVHVELRYDPPPAGKLGAAIAKLFGEDPGTQLASDLRRFKQVLETGEVVHSDASIHKGPHPAQPSAERVQPHTDREQSLVVERSADAAATASSNRDRASTTTRARTQDTRASARR